MAKFRMYQPEMNKKQTHRHQIVRNIEAIVKLATENPKHTSTL